MKKDYVKPEMLVEEILLEGMLATSMSVDQEEDDGDYSNNRRGTWGSLWN